LPLLLFRQAFARLLSFPSNPFLVAIASRAFSIFSPAHGPVPLRGRKMKNISTLLLVAVAVLALSLVQLPTYATTTPHLFDGTQPMPPYLRLDGTQPMPPYAQFDGTQPMPPYLYRSGTDPV
jgi:hypothetical protein